MQLRTRKPKHAFTSPVPPVPPAPLPELVAAQQEIVQLRRQLGRCEAAYRGWQQRALDAEQLLDSLPSEIALPHALISRTAAERDHALHLARRYRLAWTSARRRALPEPAEVHDPDGEDTQTIDRSEIPPPPAELAQPHFSAKEGGIATLHAALGQFA